MRKCSIGFARLLVVTGLFAMPAFAIEGLKINVQGGDVILSWPSVPGETYAVLHNPSLSSGSRWTVLASGLAAANTVNHTEFVHQGVIPSGQALLGGGGGGALSPLAAGSAFQFSAEPQARKWEWDLSNAEGRKPYVWEAEKRPPFPWEAAEWNLLMAPRFAQYALAGQAMQLQMNAEPATGFYQVKSVRVASGLANGMNLSGFINVDISGEADATHVRLLVDGAPCKGADVLVPPFSNPFRFEFVDTGRIANGPHTLQVEAVWNVSNTDDGGGVRALSAPFTVNVQNELSFPEWDDDTGDEVNSFYITSAHPVVNWEIDVYNYWDYLDWLDGIIPSIDPIHVKTGSTSNGKIVYHWNLVDDFGQLRNEQDIDQIFISFTFTEWQGGGASGASVQAAATASRGNPTQRQSARWPEEGLWIVAYENTFRHYYDQNNLLYEMLTGWLGSASDHEPFSGGGYPVFYQTPVGGTNAQTFPLRFNYPDGHPLHDPSPVLDKSVEHDFGRLRQWILDSRARNFYFLGHGTPEWMGDFQLSASSLTGAFGKHRYRFVWIDGCETANGGWGSAFGIGGSGTFSLDYYRERTRRPALFAGHDHAIPIGVKGIRVVNGIEYDVTLPEHVAFFRSELLFDWYFLSDTFAGALAYSRNSVRLLGSSGMRYVSGSRQGQIYEPGDALVLTGYENLRFNEYNARNEIPRP
jgi:hypothetical protein